MGNSRYLLGIFLLCGWVAAQATLSASQVRIFTPFTPGGNLVVGLAVTSEVEGTCFSGSVASPERPDAWRCSAGNEILDPCFQNLPGDGKALACAEDPFSADVVLFTLTADLPDPSSADEPDFMTSLPWALELENGERCTLLTGATAPVAGMRVNYGCEGGGQVVGGLDRTLPLWRGFYRSADRSLSLDQLSVATAWY